MSENRLISTIMALILSSTISLPTLTVAMEASEIEPSLSHHEDGAPCPDGDEHGPCESDCQCLCCPGHTTAMFTSIAVPVLFDNTLVVRRLGSIDTELPSGYCLRVFRPPRV